MVESAAVFLFRELITEFGDEFGLLFSFAPSCFEQRRVYASICLTSLISNSITAKIGLSFS